MDDALCAEGTLQYPGGTLLDGLKLELVDKVEEPRFDLREHCLVRHKLPCDLLLGRLVQRTAAIANRID